ncbi:MAG: hypothetical protein R2710_01515 [Acidimicrobiales bacterium]
MSGTPFNLEAFQQDLERQIQRSTRWLIAATVIAVVTFVAVLIDTKVDLVAATLAALLAAPLLVLPAIAVFRLTELRRAIAVGHTSVVADLTLRGEFTNRYLVAVVVSPGKLEGSRFSLFGPLWGQHRVTGRRACLCLGEDAGGPRLVAFDGQRIVWGRRARRSPDLAPTR